MVALMNDSQYMYGLGKTRLFHLMCIYRTPNTRDMFSRSNLYNEDTLLIVLSHWCLEVPLLNILWCVCVCVSAVRLGQTIDMSATIKFVYVILGGKDVAFIKKGKFGVVQGAIQALFSVRIASHVHPLHAYKQFIVPNILHTNSSLCLIFGSSV